MQNKEQALVKSKSKHSNRTWVLLGVLAIVLGFVAAKLWVTYGSCIPCDVENVWNGLQTWVKTGVCPFW